MAALTSSTAFEALSFVGVHGNSGLCLRDLIFFIEHAAIPSRAHLASLAKHSIAQYENERRSLVSLVLRAIMNNERGIQLLNAPPPLDGPRGEDGFPKGFLDTLFASAEAPRLFGEIIIAPTDELRRRILGIHVPLSEPSQELLNLVCESKGEGIRKVDLHKLMKGNHFQATIDIANNMHTIEIVRMIDIAASISEDRLTLSFLSFRQLWNRLSRVFGTNWHVIGHECSGMPAQLVTRLKIMWTFAVIAKFKVKHPKSPLAYISEEAVEAIKMTVPRFICADDVVPYAPVVLSEFPFQVSQLAHLFHECTRRCFNIVIQDRHIMKSIRKWFEGRIPDYGIICVVVPVSALRKMQSSNSSAANTEDLTDQDEDSDDEATSVAGGKRPMRVVCAFPNNPCISECLNTAVSAGQQNEDRLTLFKLEHNGKTPKQIIDDQAKVITLDPRRPTHAQLLEVTYHTRPLMYSGAVNSLRREDKKHIDRLWRTALRYPAAVEKLSVREQGCKTAEVVMANPRINALQPVVIAPLLRYPYSKRPRSSRYDGTEHYDDELADELGDVDDSEEDLDEYWMSGAGQAIIPAVLNASADAATVVGSGELQDVASAHIDGNAQSGVAAGLVPTSVPICPTSTITIETDEQLAQRMLQFIRDNTIIEGFNVVTTDQLSVMFYRSQITKIIEQLKSTVPPTIETMSIRATSKKIIGAVYFYGEQLTEDVVTTAARSYNRQANRRTATVVGSIATAVAATTTSRAMHAAKPTRAVRGSNETTTVNSAIEKIEARTANTASAQTRLNAAKTDRIATIHRHTDRLAQFWRVRNGWDGSVVRRSLRMHLELWRLVLKQASSSAASSSVVTLPRISLELLQSRMSLSTFCICLGLSVDLAAVFRQESDIQWDAPLEEIRSDELRSHYTNPKRFMAIVLPMLSLLCNRGLIAVTPPLTEGLVAQAACLMLDVSMCKELLALQVAVLPTAVVKSVLGESSEYVLAPAPPSSNSSSFSAAALTAANATVYNVHPSLIASNILDLWYTRWAADLATEASRFGATATRQFIKGQRRVEEVTDLLERQAVNATRALEEANSARVLIGNEKELELERELRRMPKTKKRRRESGKTSSSDEGSSSAGDDDDDADDLDLDSDSTATSDSEDSANDGAAIRNGRIKFRRDDYIKSIVNEGTAIAPKRDDGEQLPITRRGMHLNRDEKEQLERIIALKHPTPSQVTVIAHLLHLTVSEATALFYRRKPLLSVYDESPAPGTAKHEYMNAVEKAAVDESFREFALLRTKRGVGNNTRMVIQPFKISGLLLRGMEATSATSPLNVAQQFGTYVQCLLPYNDAFYKLLNDLVPKKHATYEEVLRTIRSIFKNANRVEARRMLALRRAAATGQIDACQAQAEEKNIVDSFVKVRNNLTVSNLAPCAGRLLAPKENAVVQTFSFGDFSNLVTGQDADFSDQKSLKRIELEELDADRGTPEELESGAELLRMISFSDKSRYSHVVSLAAQLKMRPNALRNAARRKVHLVSHTKGNATRRLLYNLAPMRPHSMMPREYGVDGLMAEPSVSSSQAGDALEAKSRSGRTTRRAAHSVFNWVMQSSWTGGINDVTSVIPELFGASAHYRAPLKVTADTHRTAETLWTQLRKSLSEGHAGDENEEDAQLPKSYVIVDDEVSRASVDQFTSLCPQVQVSADNYAESDFVESLPSSNSVSSPLWTLPTTGASDKTAGASLVDDVANPSRVISVAPLMNAASNNDLLECPIDVVPEDPAHALCVPARGDLSIFKHLDGTPNRFIVAACVAKVFDTIMGRPGITYTGLVQQIAYDSFGAWTEWHVDAALAFLENGLFIAKSAFGSAAREEWMHKDACDINASIKGITAKQQDEAEDSPFADDTFASHSADSANRRATTYNYPGHEVFSASNGYHVTLHGMTQLAAGADMGVHPVASLLKAAV